MKSELFVVLIAILFTPVIFAVSIGFLIDKENFRLASTTDSEFFEFIAIHKPAALN